MTIGDALTKDGWRYDGKKDFWTHPKRKGRIEITIEGWVHKVEDIKAPHGDFLTEKEGFSETDLQEYLSSL